MREPYALAVCLFVCFSPISVLDAQERVPEAAWSRFVDVADAGFDAQKLEAAEGAWKALDSSAFLVIAEGAVVASWGDVERRFMCHSVRKSFLSGLYGIYWDRGEIELNKTMGDLGIDDEPSPLLAIESTARILDLLKARSGIFHPAAYAGRTDSRPRGSEGPGRYFAYNNWDFNTLATILQQETGDSVFEAFDEHFGKPLGMQDWRVSDGYFHFERDKSKYPAYPFRLSARDAARYGLLFARHGLWGDQRVLSKQWVQRSSAMYSIDSRVHGYGFMWWIMREERFAKYGMYQALGVGNQSIMVIPEMDMVIVNRANTYANETTRGPGLLDLIELVLEARTGSPSSAPALKTVEPESVNPLITHADNTQLKEFVGLWNYPAPVHGLTSQGQLELRLGQGYLVRHFPTSGTFRLYAQADGSLYEEDTHDFYLVARDATGKFIGLYGPRSVVRLVVDAISEGNMEEAREVLIRAGGQKVLELQVAARVLDYLDGDPDAAERALAQLAETREGVGRALESMGRRLQQSKELFLAQPIFELNTRVCPDSHSAWTSLAGVYQELGESKEVDRCQARARALTR